MRLMEKLNKNFFFLLTSDGQAFMVSCILGQKLNVSIGNSCKTFFFFFLGMLLQVIPICTIFFLEWPRIYEGNFSLPSKSHLPKFIMGLGYMEVKMIKIMDLDSFGPITSNSGPLVLLGSFVLGLSEKIAPNNW